MIQHELIRRNSDWAVVCKRCHAEFWAAGSSVESPCPKYVHTGFEAGAL